MKTPRCTAADAGITITPQLPDAESEAAELTGVLDSYFELFARPVRTEGGVLAGGLQCLKCGRPLNGLLGTFRWGIVNGEGACANCGWPARAFHAPKDGSGEIFDSRLEIILQYHPDDVVSQP